jgi:hypothetical protein
MNFAFVLSLQYRPLAEVTFPTLLSTSSLNCWAYVSGDGLLYRSISSFVVADFAPLFFSLSGTDTVWYLLSLLRC